MCGGARQRFLFKQTLILSMDPSGRFRTPYIVQFSVYSCVCMSVWEREKEYVCLCVCGTEESVCVRDIELYIYREDRER